MHDACVFCFLVFYIVTCTVWVYSCCCIVGCHVFTSKDDAIKLIKERKGGRFKAFGKRVEAEEFSMNACGTNCLTHAIEVVL